MIPFTKISITDVEKEYINEALTNSKICGDGVFTKNVMNGLRKTVKSRIFINNIGDTFIRIGCIIGRTKSI